MTTAAGLRRGTYISNFFYALQFGLILFFNAAYLTALDFSANAIGILFAVAYAVALGLLVTAPFLLRILGNYRLFIFTALVLAGTLLWLSQSPSATLTAFLIVCVIALNVLLYALIDIFLETTSADETQTGSRRGLFVTAFHAALLLAQLGAGAFLAWGGFPALYGASTIVALLLAASIAFFLHGFRDSPYESVNWRVVKARLAESRDLRAVFFAQFLMRLFYAVIAIYTSIYLYEHLGMSLADMSLIFAIMLAPFLFLEIPLGKLEDTGRGEKSVLLAGFVITSISTLALFFITSPSIILWATALFFTRIGGAMIEMGSEVHFFRQVSGTDAVEVDAFRMLYPLAHIVGPLLAAFFLLFFPIQYIFIALGLVILLGIPAALALTPARNLNKPPLTPPFGETQAPSQTGL